MFTSTQCPYPVLRRYYNKCFGKIPKNNLQNYFLNFPNSNKQASIGSKDSSSNISLKLDELWRCVNSHITELFLSKNRSWLWENSDGIFLKNAITILEGLFRFSMHINVIGDWMRSFYLQTDQFVFQQMKDILKNIL